MKKLLGLSAALVFVSGTAFAGIAVDPIPAAHHAVHATHEHKHKHHHKGCCAKHHHHMKKCCKKHKACCHKGAKAAHVASHGNLTNRLNIRELNK